MAIARLPAGLLAPTVICLIAACTSGASAPAGATPDAGADASGGSDGPPLGTGESASGSVTVAGGGQVRLSNGAQLTIPPGAVASDLTITISETTEVAPTGYHTYSPIYRFEPEGTTFLKPVQVTLPYAGDSTLASLFWSKDAASGSGGWSWVGGAVTGATVVASVRHFSEGFVANGVDYPIPSGDAGPVPDGDATLDAADAWPSSTLWVMGYYAGYERDLYPAAEIDWTSLTHLVIGRMAPIADGSIDESFDLDVTSGPAMAKDLVTRAHAAGRKALIMVGGEGARLAFAGAASDVNRAAFVANLLKARDSYGADGLDLDWTPVDPTDRVALIDLANALRSAWPAALLTVSAPWIQRTTPSIDPVWAALAAVVDRVNVTTYAMASTASGWQSWHSSALYGDTAQTPTSVDLNVKTYREWGIPSAKLGVGIGFFGTCWQGVSAMSAPLTGATIVASDGVMSFANIKQSYYSSAAYHYDTVAKAPWLGFSSGTGPSACTLVSYEDEASIAEKGKYAKAAGLGAVTIWTLGQGHQPAAPAGSRDPLLAAVAKAFF